MKQYSGFKFVKTPFSQFINLVTLFFLSILVISAILIVKSEQERDKQVTQKGFCGVVEPEGHDKGNEIGRNLFMTNCTACHAKDMHTDATGPVLSNTLGSLTDSVKLLICVLLK